MKISQRESRRLRNRVLELERELAAAKEEIEQIREALTGQDYASLPSDYPTVRMAHSIRHDHDKFLSQVRDTCRRAEAAERERDALREDAERYRWLRECARATSEHWGGRWSLVIEGPAPGANAPPASIDAAIDAARKK